jgi:hypothetical protein
VVIKNLECSMLKNNKTGWDQFQDCCDLVFCYCHHILLKLIKLYNLLKNCNKVSKNWQNKFQKVANSLNWWTKKLKLQIICKPKVVGGWVVGLVGGWVDVKTVLWIAYSNHQARLRPALTIVCGGLVFQHSCIYKF